MIALESAETTALSCATELAEQAALAGTLAIPLVKRLRPILHDNAAAAIHLGATSQDVADTILMIQANTGTDLLVADLECVCGALYALAEIYAPTPSVGRMLLQDAMPVSFGYSATIRMRALSS